MRSESEVSISTVFLGEYVGDEGVGKSSLIVSLTKAEFIPTIQDVLPPISIPRDFSSSPTYSPKNTVLIHKPNYVGGLQLMV